MYLNGARSQENDNKPVVTSGGSRHEILEHQSSPLCTFSVEMILQYLPGLVETDRFRILIGLYAV
jgi:hypothetical protein